MRAARWLLAGTAAAVVLLVLGVALFGPLFAGEPERIVGLPYSAPTAGSPLGTDSAGRDVLDRVLAGGRPLVAVPVVATILATVLGLVLGLLGGYFAGITDAVVSRLDYLLLGLPPVLILLVLLHGWGYSATTMIIVVVLTGTPFVSRVTRAETLRAVEDGYVVAAYAGGDSHLSVIVREILPNIVRPVLADFGTRLAIAVTLTAAAAFLGFGSSGPNWGAMISQNVEGIQLTPWGVAVPAVLLGVLTVAANLGIDRIVGRVLR
ncbi:MULTISPECIES: ABC transporter permease [Micromonospora]|jgi:ABC-type dipeptide/oligopeptide/nickel transport system permease subunit|uniref:ABC transporter permease n=1 Tax=Micromonospora tulbaghiae TaxID=479978 RepID=A0A386WFG7_9ACTN|nr:MULTISPECIES: ABC transporter permease subunit [Micromonospora]AYF27037.1 ABC transporter permease [Micromonospora tulbaghiae]MCO1613310.1 ABC transporter permease subunit [Micromonospora sp. CPM1]RLQ04784.1 ABC transporter permease subunit [Micromonospora sp. BL1]